MEILLLKRRRKETMKKLMALTLALLMTLSLAACGSSGETGKTEGGSSAES